MPARLNPFFYPFACPLQLLTGRAAFHARLSFPVIVPKELKTQKGEPALHARLEAAEPHYFSLLRCRFKLEFLQFRQYLIEPLCVVLQLEWAYPVICKAEYLRLSFASWFDNLLKPEIKREVKINIC